MSRSVERRWERAEQYLVKGQLAAARLQMEAVEAAAPSHFRTRLLAAELAWREDRIRDAARHALAAKETAPDEPEALCGVVESLLRVGEVVAARECLARPALAQTREPRWLLKLSDFRQRLDENIDALALIDRAIAAGASDPEVGFHHGVQLYFNGRLPEAEVELEASFRAVPAMGRAALALSRLRTQTAQENHLDLLALGLEKVANGTTEHAALEFARYKELEDLGRYEDAWLALARGNAVMHARNRYDAAGQLRYLERLMAAFDPARVIAGGAKVDGPQPIFILGMPRSGTTVLERMLGSHSGVASAGELMDFGMQLHWTADTANTQSDGFMTRVAELDFGELGRRYLAQTQWRAGGKAFFIDKQPPNWALAGLIHAALPGARILHMVRDPMDVCFSNWRAFFGGTYVYSYDLATLAAYHRGYARAMTHWHRSMPGAILDVSYADLVRDPDATLRRVLDFCGLAWEPACTEGRNNAAPVATLSAAQVRTPLHTRAFGEWRRYEAQLSGLVHALSDVTPGEVRLP